MKKEALHLYHVQLKQQPILLNKGGAPREPHARMLPPEQYTIMYTLNFRTALFLYPSLLIRRHPN
ncbi:MAG: hypothetical protein AAF551_08245 [Bacteroidota bacterium]